MNKNQCLYHPDTEFLVAFHNFPEIFMFRRVVAGHPELSQNLLSLPAMLLRLPCSYCRALREANKPGEWCSARQNILWAHKLWAGIFAGIHSRPGDLVEQGQVLLLSSLICSQQSLFELGDFRISRGMPKGETTEQFSACMHLVLDLANKYPRDFIAPHILDVAAQFLLRQYYGHALKNCKTTGPPMQIQSFLTSGSVSLKYASTFAHAHFGRY